MLVECYRCKRKAGGAGGLRGLKLWRVEIVHSTKWTGRHGPDHRPIYEPTSWNRAVAFCADTADCELNVKIKRERAKARSGTLVWCEGRFMHATLPKGTCRWCAEPIELKDPDDYRRRGREYHRGDSHEVGSRKCQREKNRCYAFTPRDLIHYRGDPCCVYCGSEDPSWDADHEVPIWRGGEHSVVNLVRACESCHGKKTREEARERAQLRKRPSGQQRLVS